MNVNFAPDRSYKPKDIELSFGTRNQGWHLNRMLVPSLESSMDQNKRATNALASIEVKTGIVKVQGRVLLSGQFSTASRSNYICKEITTGVDKQYNQIVTDSIANCTLAYFKVVETNALFPFETKIELDFETRAKGLDDQIQTLDLGHWIKHIRYQIDSTHRDFDFYRFAAGLVVRAFQVRAHVRGVCPRHRHRLLLADRRSPLKGPPSCLLFPAADAASPWPRPRLAGRPRLWPKRASSCTAVWG